MNGIDNDFARIESEIARANPVPLANLPSADSPPARRILGDVLGARSSARLRVRLGVTVTAAAVAVVTAVLASQLLPGASSGDQLTKKPHAVTDALISLAGVAAKQPAAAPPGPGQYQYTDSVSRQITEMGYKHFFSLTFQTTRQIWIATNGSGRLAEASAGRRFATPKDRAAWIADGRPRLPGDSTSDQRFGRHGLTLGPVNEWKLPTNPARLGRLLRKRAIEGGPPGPREDFVQVGDLLRETDAPPALRAALFKIAASIPGVRVLGRVTDRLGRTGIVVAYVDRPRAGKFPGVYGLVELIFAPQTSALLDEQTVLVNARKHTATVTSWTTYIASGVVDSVTAVAPPYGHSATPTKPA